MKSLAAARALALVWACTGLQLQARSAPPAEASAQSCSCTPDASGDVQPAAVAGCAPQKVHLRQDRQSDAPGSLSLVDANRIFVQGSLPAMAKIGAEPFYCMDDRVGRPVLATPGGDMGEFILALDAYKDLTPGRNITQNMVNVWLESYLKSFPEGRVMVLCMDDRALRHLQDELQDETLSLTAPTARQQPGLTQALVEVANVGDSHIRLMLKDPANYHVDKSIVQMSLRAFYTILWNPANEMHNRVHLVELAGEPNPAAFLEVSTTQACEDAAAAPLLQPRSPALSFLVSNLDAVTARRAELANFFANHLGNNLPIHIDKETLHKRLDRHGLAALELTGSRVAKDLPFYSLTFA